MCYDISFTVKLRELALYFPELSNDPQLEIDFEGTHIIGHAYAEHPVLYRPKDQPITLMGMEWGCIPFYVKEEDKFLRQRATMLNARSERILGDDKSYWYKIRNRRCLVPVSGIYEHRAVKGWKKKVPYFIQLKDQAMFFLPGLYSVAELLNTETGELIKRHTYTIITRDANDIMKQIHNDGDNKWRMPLFLPFEQSREWLSEELSAERYKEILDFEMPSDSLQVTPVYTIRSAKPRPDEKAKNEFWEWEKLPALGEMNPEYR